METIEKRVAGDWFDVRQVIDDRFAFEDYVDLSEAEIRELAAALRLSVERGTVELKRKVVTGVITFADSQQFDSRTFPDIGRQVRELVKLIYLTLLQRTYCTGSLSPRRTAPAEAADLSDAIETKDLKSIVEDVRGRVARNEKLASNLAVKNILMQASKHRREAENMKELAPNIPKEKYPAFSANFRKSFEEITRKVRDNYAQLLRELEPPPKAPQARNMFARYDLRPLAEFFAHQARELSRIRSVLAHAEKERYKTREILSEILLHRERSLAFIDRELKEYERIAFGRGERLAREFAAEVAEYLGRKLTAPRPEE